MVQFGLYKCCSVDASIGEPMSSETHTRLIVSAGVAVVAHFAMYGLYANDIAFYMDGYTTSLVQVVFCALIMIFAYRPFFHCSLSIRTNRQTAMGTMYVVTFFMLTASRLPVPLWALLLCVVGGLAVDRKRALLVRFTVAVMLIAGAYMVMLDAVAVTNMGGVYWNQAMPADLLTAVYVVTGGVYSVALFLLGQARTPTMHTADVVRGSLLWATPFIFLIWALTWIPGFNSVNVRFGPADPADKVGVVFYVFFAAAMKLIILAAAVEFVKFGRLFEYLALSAVSYLVFPMITSTVMHGIIPLESVVGLILLVIGALISTVMSSFCTTSTYARDRDMTCRTCDEQKTWCGCMWSPITWWGQGGRGGGTHVDLHLGDEEDGVDVHDGHLPANGLSSSFEQFDAEGVVSLDGPEDRRAKRERDHNRGPVAQTFGLDDNGNYGMPLH
jgi:hypothetical protein